MKNQMTIEHSHNTDARSAKLRVARETLRVLSVRSGIRTGGGSSGSSTSGGLTEQASTTSNSP